MAAAGKKGKKGKPMSLAEFNSQGSGLQAVPEGFNKKNINPTSWADVMDGADDISVPYMKNEAVVLPTAPKAARSNDVDTSRVPINPPYKVYMGNIPYDVEEADLLEFFGSSEPVNIQLPKGDRGSRGFGYVEFGDRESLIAALAKDGTALGQRTVRVSLPEESGRDQNRDDRPRRDGMGGEGRDPARTDNDWRREPREIPPAKPDTFGSRDRGSGFDRPSGGGGGFDRPSGGGGGFDRPSGGGGGFDRPSGGGGFGSRNGTFQPHSEGFSREQRSYDAGPERDFGDVRKRDPNFGPGSNWSSSDRPQEQRRGFVPAPPSQDRPSFGDRDRYQDRYQSDRRSDQGYQQSYDSPREYQRPPRESPQDSEPRQDAAQGVPAERRRLQLQPRSKPKDEVAAPAEITRSSIFGDAKPVDTARKELEIEEKRKQTSPSVVTEGDSSLDDESRIRRTSTGSGKSGPRSRQTSESGSHNSPREGERVITPRAGGGYQRQDSEGSHSDRRPPPRILTNPDRDRRDHFGGGRDDRRDNFDRGNQNNQPGRGGFTDRPQYNRPDNNGRSSHPDDRGGQRGGLAPRGHSDDHNNKNNERNNDRKDRPKIERPDRPKNELRVDKKEPEYTMPNKFTALNVEDDLSFDATE